MLDRKFSFRECQKIYFASKTPLASLIFAARRSARSSHPTGGGGTRKTYRDLVEVRPSGGLRKFTNLKI